MRLAAASRSGLKNLFDAPGAAREMVIYDGRVGARQARTGLVEESGCGEGSGAIQPGAGLMRLRRLALAAGMCPVAANARQVTDFDGVRLVSFQRSVRTDGKRAPVFCAA
jgi:hypothetical protein